MTAMTTVDSCRYSVGVRSFAFGMRRSIVAAFVVAAFSVFMPTADAADCPNPDALGVGRTVEIDTTDGPRYGQQQYKDINLLGPKEVVLTFDDGPLRRNTRAVLEALGTHCTKATFFMVGRQAVADPDMVKEVARRGHSLALHTWSHMNLGRARADRAVAEIELGLSAVKAAAGNAAVLPFFRFPYLSDSKRIISYLRARDIAMFSIDVDSYDYRTRSGSEMHRKIISQLESRGQRGILLFHDIQASTARGIKPLLDDLSRRGYKVVHLVAKGQARTLPEYDEEAKRLLEKRNYTVASKPLVTRSFTWQMPPPGADEKIAERVQSWKPTSTRPPAGSTPLPPAGTAEPSATRAAARPEPDWRKSIFER